MTEISLKEFLLRVQAAGVCLDGCEIKKEDMDDPHIFIGFDVVHGTQLVKVLTAGQSRPANLIKDLVVQEITPYKKLIEIVKGPQVLKVVFKYPSS